MKNKVKISVFGALGVFVAAAVLVVLVPGAARVEASKEKSLHGVVDMANVHFSTDSTVPGKDDDIGDMINPALESVLNRLIDVYKNEGPEAAAEFAAQRKIPFKDNRVHVTLEANPLLSSLSGGSNNVADNSREKQTRAESINRSVSLVTAEIERLGGQVENSRHSQVYCSIGIQALEELTRMPLVRSIRRSLRPIKHEVTSEGVQKTGAADFQGLFPYKSGGVKVCVIDVGFQGYRDLLGSELPGTVTALSFTQDGDIEAGEVHGTACAEIIHDMAPDAELYLANIYWDSDLVDAVNWAVAQQVDVISYSLGTYFGAGDGTGLDSALAQFALQTGGIVWVTSAGNSADDHWSGTFNDPDGDGWHNFSGNDELLSFYVPAEIGLEYGVDAYLKWNDWGTWDGYDYSGSNQDFDLYLFIKQDGQWYLVDSSENRQPQFTWPWESIAGWYSPENAEWGVAIRKNQANKNVFFDLYIPYHDFETLEYRVARGSLTAPADSPYVIAVGAVDAVGDYIHYYSSQGPTADGRIKPDLCAPSWVSTSNTTYGLRNSGDGFGGTSASCPHVAGAIALLKGKTPFTLEEIKNILYSRVIDMGTPGMDNIYGRGRLNLRR